MRIPLRCYLELCYWSGRSRTQIFPRLRSCSTRHFNKPPKLQQVQMSHYFLIYLLSCASNLDTEQAFGRSLASCVIYNHVSSFIKKSVSGAGASAETAAFHPLCAKQGSPSPGEARTEGRGVSGSASECQASKRTSPEDIRAWRRHSADLLHRPFISFLFSFRTHSQSLTCRKKELAKQQDKGSELIKEAHAAKLPCESWFNVGVCAELLDSCGVLFCFFFCKHIHSQCIFRTDTSRSLSSLSRAKVLPGHLRVQ